MWTYEDELPKDKPKGPVVTNIRKAPRAPANSLGEWAYNTGKDIYPSFKEAYDRATSSTGAGTGEIGATIRGLEDLFNLDDRMQQAELGGDAAARELARESAQVKKVRQTRAVWNELDKLNPNWREDSSIVDNVARVTGSFLGDMAGNANPTYLIGGGSSALARAGVQGGVNAGIDAALQAGELNSGISDEFDPKRVAIQFLTGAALQGGGELVGRSLGLGKTPEGQPDFNSDEFAREEIVGDVSPQANDFAGEMQDALLAGADQAEIDSIFQRYGKTPETRTVENPGGPPVEFNEADEAFTNQLTGRIQEPDASENLDLVDTPEVDNVIPLSRETPTVEGASEALVQLRKIANDMHMDAEVDGGKYPLGQLGAIHKKVAEGIEAGKFKGADLEEATNIKDFLDEAIYWRDQSIRNAEVEAGVADRAPPVDVVEANRGAGDIQRTPANDVEGVQLRPTEEEALTLGDNPSNADLEASRGVRVNPETGEVEILPRGGGGEPPSDTRPAKERLVEALEGAKKLTAQQKKLYSEERKSRLRDAYQAARAAPGEAGHRARMSALKGEMPKVDFEGVGNQFSKEDIEELFNDISNSDRLTGYEPVNAGEALRGLLEGKLPTPSQLTSLSKVFGTEVVKSLVKHKSTSAKAFDGLLNAINLPRSLMATADLSAPFRQGIFMVGRKEFWNNWKTMFKAFGSEDAFKGIQDEIKSRNTYPAMEDSKLAILDMDGDLTKREEDFISQWAEKIPLVRRSGRAYTAFLNKLRADAFDNIYRKYTDMDIPISTTDLSRYINSATGRGDLGKLNSSAPLLNATFFSPRLIKSRVDLLTMAFDPRTYMTLDPSVRKEAFSDLFKFGGIALTVLGLAKMGGAEVQDDPRSTDFGKIKVGNTRYDVLGGFGQYVTLAARIMTDSKLTNAGEEVELSSNKGYKADSRADVLSRFGRNKLAPIPAYVVNYLDGENVIGEEFEADKDAAKLAVPLMWQQMYETMQEEGYTKGAAMSIPGVFGVGVSTYGEKEPKETEDSPSENEDVEETPSSVWTYED